MLQNKQPHQIESTNTEQMLQNKQLHQIVSTNTEQMLQEAPIETNNTAAQTVASQVLITKNCCLPPTTPIQPRNKLYNMQMVLCPLVILLFYQMEAMWMMHQVQRLIPTSVTRFTLRLKTLSKTCLNLLPHVSGTLNVQLPTVFVHVMNNTNAVLVILNHCSPEQPLL